MWDGIDGIDGGVMLIKPQTIEIRMEFHSIGLHFENGLI